MRGPARFAHRPRGCARCEPPTISPPSSSHPTPTRECPMFPLQPRRAVGALFLSVLALLIVAAAPGTPPGRIEGFVKDSAGAPIVNAQVFVIPSSGSALTDRQGHYLISNVPAGTVTLRAAFVGYRPLRVSGVVVSAGKTTRQDFTLAPSVVSVQDLAVTAEAPLVPRDQVNSRPAPTGAGQLSIRGGRTDGKVDYVDGVPVQAERARQSAATNGFTSGAAITPPVAQACCYAQPYSAPQNFNTEEYAHLRENGFRPVASAPLSTFSIDVGIASYANVRRFLTQGALPPADAV